LKIIYKKGKKKNLSTHSKYIFYRKRKSSNVR
jgi:hypothetical protein